MGDRGRFFLGIRPSVDLKDPPKRHQLRPTNSLKVTSFSNKLALSELRLLDTNLAQTFDFGNPVLSVSTNSFLCAKFLDLKKILE